MNHPHRIHRLICGSTLVVASALLATTPLSAQDALGDGRSLDANLSPTTRYNTPTQDTSLSYRLRNLEVTGNIAGGRGFRGNVGYKAAGDFRGKLGSNDLYQFMAGSAYSSPDFIRYRDRFAQVELGQSLGLMEYRRAGGGVVDPNQPSYFDRPASLRLTESFTDRQFRIDEATVHQSIDESLNGILSPLTIGTGVVDRDDVKTRIVITASGLQGMKQRVLGEQMLFEGMPLSDRLALAQDFQNGLTVEQLASPFQLSVDAIVNAIDANVNPDDPAIVNPTVDLSINNGISNQYENIIQTMNDRSRAALEAETGGAENPPSESFEQRYQSLLELMEQLEAEAEENGEVERPNIDPETMEPIISSDVRSEIATKVNEGGEGNADEGSDGGADGNGGEPAAEAPVVDPARLDEMANILRHDHFIDSLSTDSDSRFNQLLEEGSADLLAGDYFWAERRFMRALRLSANHPMAMVGKAHAQLGAGLFHPAAVSLHTLFKRSPELIDTRFAPELLPSMERLDECMASIRTQLEKELSPSRRARMAMLLAYIGHQQGNDAAIREGLDRVVLDSPNDPLHPLLTRIWLVTD